MSERTLTCVKDFRHAVVQTLIGSDIEGFGSNVSASRQMKVWPEEESYVMVNIPNVNFDDKGTNPRFYYAKADLNIDVYARAFLDGEDNLEDVESDSDLNDFLDKTANAIVAAIDPCKWWKGPYQGLVTKCVLRSYANNLSDRTETERGSARITFEVSFTIHVDKTAPTVDFLRAKNEVKVDGNGESMSFTTNLRPTNT